MLPVCAYVCVWARMHNVHVSVTEEINGTMCVKLKREVTGKTASLGVCVHLSVCGPVEMPWNIS